MSKIAVFGSGSWGTAFSIVLADAGNEVRIWGRREECCPTINTLHQNTDYLPGVDLPHAISATSDPAEAVADAEYVVLAVPSQTLRENLANWAPLIPSDAVFVSLMKGVELGTTKRMSEVIAEVTGAGPERIAVISGPNLAKEIAAREPAASVVACADEVVAQRLQDVCHSRAFRPYWSADVVGCELGGAYKNVVALCVGMAVGLGFGDNTTASVITRGLAETARLAVKLGAEPMALMGLAGLGDLAVHGGLQGQVHRVGHIGRVHQPGADGGAGVAVLHAQVGPIPVFQVVADGEVVGDGVARDEVVSVALFHLLGFAADDNGQFAFVVHVLHAVGANGECAMADQRGRALGKGQRLLG
ncbi:MAG TPA: NAD(P)H-dependent glycerol-3-phosphate dehydrogenase, partial [Marmoricola sp.]|nr:NAD(P)H-dependent glycerol-3-phosphate dehydrogenase [Marmoricola sp.]